MTWRLVLLVAVKSALCEAARQVHMMTEGMKGGDA